MKERINFQTELSLFKKWWRTWGSFPVLSWVRAAALYRAGKFHEAQVHYRKGLKKHVGHPAELCARLDLAYCLFKMKRFEDAQAELRHVITHMPRSSEAYLRLAKVQLWTGQALDAAWTMRRALRDIGLEAELVATFLLAVIENGGPGYLLEEAIKATQALTEEKSVEEHLKLRVARARLHMLRGNPKKGRDELMSIADQDDAPIESLILSSELLIQEGKVAHARRSLRQAMQLSADHPRVLSLFAESYLRSGPFFNAEYALQLAVTACQNTGWLSPREMHILAEAYYHCGDKVSALIVASKARHLGGRLLSQYRDVKNLDKLIETLSSGTQA